MAAVQPEYERQILAVLDEHGGMLTGDVAREVTPQFGHSARAHTFAVRAWLLGLQAQGMVAPMDDRKPVCWIRVASVGAVGA